MSRGCVPTPTPTADIRVGTAGWSIPRASASSFLPPPGTHLERYSRGLGCAEINTSFYRPHAAATYAKWRASTPPDFRFAVKMPRAITHEHRLEDVRELLVAFLTQTEGLAEKRGPILIQLPPSFVFDDAVASAFFDLVRAGYDGPVVCEPRHATWFSATVNAVLERFRISRVAADPAPVPEAARPAGWPGLAYFRLHGSPRMYWSKYPQPFIARLASQLRQVPRADEVWCVFDNTASGSAIENALELRNRVANATMSSVVPE
jgi:uncharacterized protein YecE (DUF72 family)